MDVLDVVETLILLKTVLQETMLMVRPWIHLTQNQILLNQTKVLATVVDVARTLPKIVTQEHTSMAFLCDRLFNIFLLYNCFIESDKSSLHNFIVYSNSQCYQKESCHLEWID